MRIFFSKWYAFCPAQRLSYTHQSTPATSNSSSRHSGLHAINALNYLMRARMMCVARGTRCHVAGHAACALVGVWPGITVTMKTRERICQGHSLHVHGKRHTSGCELRTHRTTSGNNRLKASARWQMHGTRIGCGVHISCVCCGVLHI